MVKVKVDVKVRTSDSGLLVNDSVNSNYWQTVSWDVSYQDPYFTYGKCFLCSHSILMFCSILGTLIMCYEPLTHANSYVSAAR